MKLRRVANESGTEILYLFWCPGCKETHPYTTATQTGGKPSWGFNGNMEKPSFTPSLLCWPSRTELRCHLYVTDGRIQYLGDCHHALAGQTIDLPEIPAESGWADEPAPA
jgi:hypothetical protein